MFKKLLNMFYKKKLYIFNLDKLNIEFLIREKFNIKIIKTCICRSYFKFIFRRVSFYNIIFIEFLIRKRNNN